MYYYMVMEEYAKKIRCLFDSPVSNTWGSIYYYCVLLVEYYKRQPEV